MLLERFDTVCNCLVIELHDLGDLNRGLVVNQVHIEHIDSLARLKILELLLQVLFLKSMGKHAFAVSSIIHNSANQLLSVQLMDLFGRSGDWNVFLQFSGCILHVLAGTALGYRFGYQQTWATNLIHLGVVGSVREFYHLFENLLKNICKNYRFVLIYFVIRKKCNLLTLF